MKKMCSVTELLCGDIPVGTLVKTTIDGCEHEFLIKVDEDGSNQEKTLLTRDRKELWIEYVNTQQLLLAEFEVLGLDPKENLKYGDKVVTNGRGSVVGEFLGKDTVTEEYYVRMPNGSILSYDYDDIEIYVAD